MGRSQETFGKKEKEKKRLRKRKDKAEKKAERKANSKGGGLENMLAYVDEFGNILETPPDPDARVEVDVDSIELGATKRPEEDLNAVREGKIDYYNDQKGYGFIKEAGTSESFFVHINGMIDDDLNEGDRVVFELEKGPKGMNAVRVKRWKKPEPVKVPEPPVATEENSENKEETPEAKVETPSKEDDKKED